MRIERKRTFAVLPAVRSPEGHHGGRGDRDSVLPCHCTNPTPGIRDERECRITLGVESLLQASRGPWSFKSTPLSGWQHQNMLFPMSADQHSMSLNTAPIVSMPTIHLGAFGTTSNACYSRHRRKGNIYLQVRVVRQPAPPALTQRAHSSTSFRCPEVRSSQGQSPSSPQPPPSRRTVIFTGASPMSGSSGQGWVYP